MDNITNKKKREQLQHIIDHNGACNAEIITCSSDGCPIYTEGLCNHEDDLERAKKAMAELDRQEASSDTDLISMDKKYKTRDGCAVRIFSLDCGGNFPVAGAILGREGVWLVERWTMDGHYISQPRQNCNDLIEVKEKHKRKIFLNIYDTEVCAHISLDSANDCRRTSCVAVKEVELEYEEGEGL